MRPTTTNIVRDDDDDDDCKLHEHVIFVLSICDKTNLHKFHPLSPVIARLDGSLGQESIQEAHPHQPLPKGQVSLPSSKQAGCAFPCGTQDQSHL